MVVYVLNIRWDDDVNGAESRTAGIFSSYLKAAERMKKIYLMELDDFLKRNNGKDKLVYELKDYSAEMYDPCGWDEMHMNIQAVIVDE